MSRKLEPIEDIEKLEKIESLLKATNLTKQEIPLLAMFIHSLEQHQIDALYEVLYQLNWERNKIT